MKAADFKLEISAEENREASWSAPAPWCFGGIAKEAAEGRQHYGTIR